MITTAMLALGITRCFSFSKMAATIGSKISEIETPALLVDLDKFEGNLRRLSSSLTSFNVAVRPHAKAHKCPAIGRMQVEHGAVGLCCQKLTEAESMVLGGVKDVLITNEVVEKSKLLRLASLAKQAAVSVCVDDEQNVKHLSEAARTLGSNIGVIIEINAGQDRCGVESGVPAVNLAKVVRNHSNLTLKGFQAYQGWNQHVRKHSDRKEAVDKVIAKARETLTAFKAENIPCDVVTGGGTGTYMFEAASGIFTEVQPGSYIFMDADYGRNLDKEGKFVSYFEQSLFVLSTVISVTPGSRAILDAGMKAVSLDSGVPLVKDRSDLTFDNGGDEHGILTPSGDLKVGDQVWLVPGHCDPTVNLYDWIAGVRNGIVETVWPITGRGPGV